MVWPCPISCAILIAPPILTPDDPPTLIIHGAEDWIIPVAEAEALHVACPAPQKHLVKIRGAGHNDLMVHGYGTYFSQIRSFLESIRSASR